MKLLSVWLLATIYGLGVKTVPLVPVTAPVDQEVLEVDSSRLVRMNGFVGPDLIKEADKMIELADENTKPIFVSLNGPGGYVSIQHNVTDVMDRVRARGIKLICFTEVMAMSATFNMMLHCDERYGLEGAIFLFHPVKAGMMSPMRAIDALQLARELNALDMELIAALAPHLTIEQSEIFKFYMQERVWHARELAAVSRDHWLKTVRDIHGAKEAFNFLAPNGLHVNQVTGQIEK